MPIYEFKCPAGHVTEVWVARYADRPDFTTCDCGALATKMISTAHWISSREHATGESAVSRGIGRVRQAEREGKLD